MRWLRTRPTPLLATMLAIGVLSALSCIDDVAGGVEGGNTDVVAFAGVVLDSAGTPAHNVRIEVLPAGYRQSSPGAVKATTGFTDEHGTYRITLPDTGRYGVTLYHADSVGAFFTDTFTTYGEQDTLYRTTVRRFGALAARLTSDSITTFAGRLYAHGTGISGEINIDGSFLISLPPGELTVAVVIDSAATITLIDKEIGPGELSDIGTLHLEDYCGDLSCDSLVIRAILDSNGLDTVPVIDSMYELSGGRIRKLRLRDLGLSVIPADLSRLPELTTCDFTGNNLTTLPASLGRMKNLRWIFIGENRFDTLPECIWEVTELSRLVVSRNALTTISSRIGQMQRLWMLGAWENQLTSIPAEIGQCRRLYQLSLRANALVTIPASVAYLPDLGRLTLAHNRIDSLPPDITRLDSLDDFSIGYNRLCTVPAGPLRDWLDANDSTWEQSQECF